MKNLFIFLAVLIFTISFTLSELPAQQKRGGKIGDKIKQKLNLSDEQQNQIKEIKLQHQKEMVDLKAELEKRKIAMKELKQNINFSREEFISAIQNINDIKNQIAIAQANHQMDVYSVLDDAQKEGWLKMEGKLLKRKHLMGEHRMKKLKRF